jgi:hypothetical protein
VRRDWRRGVAATAEQLVGQDTHLRLRLARGQNRTMPGPPVPCIPPNAGCCMSCGEHQHRLTARSAPVRQSPVRADHVAFAAVDCACNSMPAIQIDLRDDLRPDAVGLPRVSCRDRRGPSEDVHGAPLRPAFASLDLLVITVITPETERMLPAAEMPGLRARMHDALVELVDDDPLDAWQDTPVLELSGPLDGRPGADLAALNRTRRLNADRALSATVRWASPQPLPHRAAARIEAGEDATPPDEDRRSWPSALTRKLHSHRLRGPARIR